MIISLAKKRAGLYASRAFVCNLAFVIFLSFSHSLGVGGRLRIVIVALPVTYHVAH